MNHQISQEELSLSMWSFNQAPSSRLPLVRGYFSPLSPVSAGPVVGARGSSTEGDGGN